MVEASPVNTPVETGEAAPVFLNIVPKALAVTAKLLVVNLQLTTGEFDTFTASGNSNNFDSLYGVSGIATDNATGILL